MSGATKIFKRMDIGSLDVSDYLGIFHSAKKNFVVNSCGYISLTWVIFIIAALGAIFSATDSVCTLQVWQKYSFSVSRLHKLLKMV